MNLSLRSTLRGAAAAVALMALTGAAACGPREAGGASVAVSPDALRAAATDPDVRAFYEARAWKGAWSPESEQALTAALNGAVRHGLDPTTFVRLIQAAQGEAARDAQLTLAALTYARALAVGAVDPAKLHQIFALDRPKTDIAAGLNQALDANNLDAWLASLAPQDADYRALSEAYAGYRSRASEDARQPVPAGADLKIGQTDARVPAIAQRLAAAGYIQVAEGAPAGQVFTREMSDALKALQRDARIRPTGVVDALSVAALNQIAADRARQLAINLERRRWMARDPAPTRIDVNIAAAELVYLRDNAPAWTSRAVVGSAENATPLLGETFKQLVVNPPWNVPDGIAKEEILPKGDAYLAAQDMYVEDGRVVQRPGPKAALGQVKFDMQNRHAIYLHDTPAKALFATGDRHRSHGCVRVEKAVEFARFLANERGQAEAFDAALQSGETKVVPLNSEVPVRLMYLTAYVADDGRIVFADDPYRWDDKLGQAMGLGASRTSGPAQPVAALLGP